MGCAAVSWIEGETVRPLRLSIIIPALNEAAVIDATLVRLQPLRERGAEVILADGGSDDGTVERAAGQVDRVVAAPPGRARQMNAGAAAAGGEWLWFLHADTVVPAEADAMIPAALVAAGREWGRCRVRLSGRHPLFRIIERLMNLRSCLTGIATGDQGLVVQRAAFEVVGGYPELPLMEDIELSRALRRRGRPVCLATTLTTSSRRWEANGILRTVVLMWGLRLRWFLGADVAGLARRYR